ncbi:Serine hydroxymethyltransferase [Paenibacillus solanacearum]|uniref:Serine hydroxymethyltransferase n=1 Tax=Paenibacillus solanacearum TaxID=2048548 RepID=A0A916K4G4_9BACL|nr:serine hydroxymethyltransferase [Paenibacillus solanacearum]CAG7623517.1 Serine hydroxymethyltransferase [Paenibacillus solanacearum]
MENAVRYLTQYDPEVGALASAEAKRQQRTLSLIPSENYTSKAVQLALATAYANKYAEGYPYVWSDGSREDRRNGRYYRGQEYTNELERLAIRRALQLFTPDPGEYHANVQPLSGAPANLAVLSAFLKPGDTFLGLALDYGGHLTHGHGVNITGQYYNAVQYRLNDSYELDYDEIRRLAKQHAPKIIFCGATAYPLRISFRQLGAIARETGALLVADIAHICGLCVTGCHEHPFPHADIVTTTTHKLLRGPRAGLIVCKKPYGAAIDRALFPGLQGGPHMNAVAAMAVALKEAMSPDYQRYAGQVVRNAKRLSKLLQEEGFKLMGGRTDNHLLLLDVVGSAGGLGAKDGSWLAKQWETAGIVANKNTIPGDTRPWYPSGVRLGTPAITTIGMIDQDMVHVAEWIIRATRHAENETELRRIRDEIGQFMEQFAFESFYV